MAKINFTAARIESLGCAPGRTQTIHWDAKAPGLGLRVTAAGSRSYVFEGRLFGKTVRMTIGDTATWDLAQARAEAMRLALQVDQGIDPREQQAAEKAAHMARAAEAKRRAATFGDAWDDYVQRRQQAWSKWHLRDHMVMAAEGGQAKKRGTGTTQAGPLAEFRPVRLSDLTPARIETWLEAGASFRPTTTALAYRLLRAFLRWAGEQPEYRDTFSSDTYAARVVREAVPRVRAKDGDVLQREQLADWFAAVRAIPNQVISAYLQGLLLTGARREELANLRWATDVDLKWRTLVLDDKVEGTGGRTIPLPPYLAGLFEELKRLNETPPHPELLKRLAEQGKPWKPSPWVFPSPRATDGRLAEPRAAHMKALASAGLPHLSLHGLRRSFGTLAEWCEVPVGVVAQIQGHKPSAIAEKHYRRRPLDLLRKWHDQIELWIVTEAKLR